MTVKAPDAGAAPTWVLCHGTPLTPSVWDRVADVLRPMGAVWQPALVPGPAGAEVVTELTQGIVDRLPPGGVHLVGHSFGGQVALEAALIAGSAVESLTMVCSRDTPFPPFAAAAQALRAGEPLDADAVLQRWFRPDEAHMDGWLVRYARACIRHADADGWARSLEAIARFDRSSATTSLHIPVHLIAAELDQVSTVAAMGAMARRLPHSRLTVVGDAAHMSIFQQPQMLASLIASCLRQKPRPAWTGPVAATALKPAPSRRGATTARSSQG